MNDVVNAQALMAANRYEEAIPLLQRALVQRPQDPQPRCLLAICLLNVGKPKDAAKMAATAIALDPHAELPHRIRSEALAAIGKRKKSLLEAEEAVRADPDEARALFALGEQLLHRRWRLKRAAETVRRGLALDPASQVGLELMGRIALRRRKWKEAEDAYRKVLAAYPLNWAVMNNLAIALQRQGRQREAIEMFEMAARANPRSKLAQRNLYLETRRYVGVGILAFVLLINGARVLNGYSRTNPVAALIMLLILIGAVQALIFIRWRRKRNLPATARTFYEVERRRDLRRRGPFLVIWFIGALTVVFGSLMLYPSVHEGSLVLMVGGVLAWWFGWRYLWANVLRSWVEARF